MKDNQGTKITKFKKERIVALYTKEPWLEISAYEERFNIAEPTLKQIFKQTDKMLKRGKYKQ